MNLVVSGEICLAGHDSALGRRASAAVGPGRFEQRPHHPAARPAGERCSAERKRTRRCLPPRDDLSRFQEIVESRPALTRIALLHFDQVQHRDYGIDFFTTLRYLATERRKIVLLIQSRAAVRFAVATRRATLRSQLDSKTVELRGRT